MKYICHCQIRVSMSSMEHEIAAQFYGLLCAVRERFTSSMWTCKKDSKGISRHN